MLALDHLDLEDIKVLRERSLHKMKKMVEKRRQGVSLGYGEYMEIYVLKVFFSVVKASDRVVCQFYCENWPFKQSSLPNNNNAKVHGYGRSSFTNSLSTARTFLSLTQKFLQRSSGLTTGAIAGLKDCSLLAELNVDYILESSTIIKQAQTLFVSQADTVHTLMISILTNTQTCLDGLEEIASSWSLKDRVYVPLVNATMFYSVSLSLFQTGWVPTTKRVLSRTPKRRGAFAHVRFPFKTSDKNKEILQKIGRRHLLQDDNDYIIVSNIVIVSQDGTGDFTTINDALTLAPNKTIASDGYFVIYVIIGVYEEYVSIPNNNKYIMMIGDGINQTVITGNHSTADGLATFNSAIFAVVGQGFIAVNITFWNTTGAVNHQAVTMRSRADMSTFYSCSFEGYQDTLYPHSNRQFYTECDIYGTVDFIFGNGAAVLQDCNIYPHKFKLYILQVMKERAKNRVDDLQGMFCDLKLARKESRTNDVALLEEQVNQMLGEWQSDIVFTLVQSGVCAAFSRVSFLKNGESAATPNSKVDGSKLCKLEYLNEGITRFLQQLRYYQKGYDEPTDAAGEVALSNAEKTVLKES
ncbi:putative pectinesterase/pectinesterase inhibitor 41 [Apium graveolens]|uniref:putative pectinesterase/pectinesterase inhibitor 41 n=1 Tax=Apium graveolens TaxID=4045 RepID=UPI003D78E5CE